MATFTEEERSAPSVKPCVHGHTSGRNRSGNCTECVRLHGQRWRKNNPTHSRQWQIANPDRARSQKLKSTYGITLEAMATLFESQGRCCPVCLRPGHINGRGAGPGGEVALYVEHCHQTGRIRGLVCQRCNLLISNHDSKILRCAADFVARFEEG